MVAPPIAEVAVEAGLPPCGVEQGGVEGGGVGPEVAPVPKGLLAARGRAPALQYRPGQGEQLEGR
jgi:hypothetical protein